MNRKIIFNFNKDKDEKFRAKNERNHDSVTWDKSMWKSFLRMQSFAIPENAYSLKDGWQKSSNLKEIKVMEGNEHFMMMHSLLEN